MNRFTLVLVLLFTTCFVAESQINLKKIKKKASAVAKKDKSKQGSATNTNEVLDLNKTSKSGACDSNYKTLKRYLQKLQDKKVAGDVAKSSFKSAIGTAERTIKTIKSKCPDFDISTETNELAIYAADHEASKGGADDRQAQIRKGYYDNAIKELVADSHPAYNDFYRARVDLLTIAFESFRHDKPTNSFKAVKESRVAFAKIKSQNNDLDLSLVDAELDRLQGMLDAQYGDEISKTLSQEDAVDYFRTIYGRLTYFYSDTDYGADATQGLKPGYTHEQLNKTVDFFKNFSKEAYLRKVEDAMTNGTYPRVQTYVEKVVAALDDYPNFISKSRGAFNGYLSPLNTIGIKGDPQKEMDQLNAAKVFCQMLLKFAPADPTASQWLNQVEDKIAEISGNITYASNMHKKHLSEMLFSTKEVTIGGEVESDFTTSFNSGEYVYATVYLPATMRQLSDSYAANDVMYKVNGSIISEASSTAVWVTTPMQEKNYLQFAIVPDDTWYSKNSKPYIENKLRTHEHIANALLTAGPYSGITVDVQLKFRGTGSKINASFTIDQSGGVDHLKQIVGREENARLSDAKLPAAGMSDQNLENQALAIMRKKSEGRGKTYSRAIITSPNWDYDKTYAGITVSRSIVIALVSKEHDGKCMYQYFNFAQQEKGNGTYNSNLQFAGAGDNVYISCDNR